LQQHCFSASAPPFLSKVCVASIQRLQGDLKDLHREFRTESNNNVLTDAHIADLDKEISGPQLRNKLRENISNLYSKGAFKYVEDVAPGLRLEMDLHSIHHTSVSQFQEVQ
jgi:hypothetical protein